jgi:hypothetical protein
MVLMMKKQKNFKVKKGELFYCESSWRDTHRERERERER